MLLRQLRTGFPLYLPQLRFLSVLSLIFKRFGFTSTAGACSLSHPQLALVSSAHTCDDAVFATLLSGHCDGNPCVHLLLLHHAGPGEARLPLTAIPFCRVKRLLPRPGLLPAMFWGSRAGLRGSWCRYQPQPGLLVPALAWLVPCRVLELQGGPEGLSVPVPALRGSWCRPRPGPHVSQNPGSLGKPPRLIAAQLCPEPTVSPALPWARQTSPGSSKA